MGWFCRNIQISFADILFGIVREYLFPSLQGVERLRQRAWQGMANTLVCLVSVVRSEQDGTWGAFAGRSRNMHNMANNA